MEQTQILCFPSIAELKTIIEREKLSKEKVLELNEKLKTFANSKNLNWLDIEQFNRISGLHVNFKRGEHFYSIHLKFDKGCLYFEASFRMFDSKNYDSDDEEDNKLTSYIFKPFDYLHPIVNKDGTKELTLDMYFNFVHKCINDVPFYVKPKKSK